MIRIRLSRLLGERRWSQAKLSDITGIRATTISHIYNDQPVRVPLEYFDRICNALGCDLSDLLEYTPDEERVLWQDYVNRQQSKTD